MCVGRGSWGSLLPLSLGMSDRRPVIEGKDVKAPREDRTLTTSKISACGSGNPAPRLIGHKELAERPPGRPDCPLPPLTTLITTKHQPFGGRRNGRAGGEDHELDAGLLLEAQMHPIQSPSTPLPWAETAQPDGPTSWPEGL